jgi:hypothetical protein
MWQRMASDPSTGLRTGLHPKLLAQVAHTVPFAGLPDVFPQLLQGRLRGRAVVEIRAGT